MLQRICVDNFKSWMSLSAECMPITGFFGKNSSGKTSILQFILLLKQTKDAQDRSKAISLDESLVSLGVAPEYLCRYRDNDLLSWRIEMKLDEKLALEDSTSPGTGGKRGGNGTTFAEGDVLKVGSKVMHVSDVPICVYLSYELDDREFELAPKENLDAMESLSEISKVNLQESLKFDLKFKSKNGAARDFKFVKNRGRYWSLPGPIKSYAFPDQAYTYFKNTDFLADMVSAYERQIDKIFYLGPLRKFPERRYPVEKSRSASTAIGIGSRGEHTVDAIVNATLDGRKCFLPKDSKQHAAKATAVSLQEKISYWLKQMGLIHQFRMKEVKSGLNLWEAQIRIVKGASYVSLPDVGFGVSQVLPVITLLELAPTGSTVLLEQPEIHLHPLAQAELADVIIHNAVDRGVQVLLESHSEHLLLRIQRRIAERRLRHDETKLYFVGMPEKESELRELQLNELGEITKWPEKFLGDAFNELALTLEARYAQESDEERKGDNSGNQVQEK